MNPEKQLLGSVLIHFENVDKFLSRVKETDFSDKRHKYLYGLIKRLYNNNVKTFDATNVYATYPKALGYCGGVEYIGEIVSECISPKDIDSKIDAVIKASIMRDISLLNKEADEHLKDGFESWLSFVRLKVNSICDRYSKEDKVDLYSTFLSSLEPTATLNVDFGFKSLHNVLGYPHPGELLVIGARPGMGKTAFALSCLFNYICLENKRAVMFSLEMSGQELFSRMISSISRIPLTDIRSGNLDDEAKKVLDTNAKELSSNKFLSLYDKSLSNISSLRSALRKESEKGEIGLVIVDYLQLLSGNGNNNYEKVSEISRQLKLIARDFNCTVVALSQLSRKVEDRADKRPQLSDLRESGAIEQDADYVLFLYRHNYYVKDPSVDPTKDPLTIEVAKNRHGKTGTVMLDFDLTTGSFH